MAAWKYLVVNLDWIALYASVVVGVTGFLAFSLVCFLWNHVAPWYREFLAKLGVAVFRFLAAASAVASKFASVPPDTSLAEQPWVLTTLIAVVGYLLWEVAGAIGDHKHKLAKEKDKSEQERQIAELTQDRDDAEAQSVWFRLLVSHLRKLVSEKRERIRRVLLASAKTRGSLPKTRSALAPTQQISMLLEKLASLFQADAVAAGGHHNQNFRIGLYAEDNGHLIPVDAFDLNTRRHDPFSSIQQHLDRFRLDNDVNPSHAVRAVREGRMLIVPDCANHPVFQHFHALQPHYLKSLVAFPLFDFSPDGATLVRAALLIDTDVAGFFKEEESQKIQDCLTEFAVRITLEYTIKGLTN